MYVVIRALTMDLGCSDPPTVTPEVTLEITLGWAMMLRYFFGWVTVLQEVSRHVDSDSETPRI